MMHLMPAILNRHDGLWLGWFAGTNEDWYGQMLAVECASGHAQALFERVAQSLTD